LAKEDFVRRLRTVIASAFKNQTRAWFALLPNQAIKRIIALTQASSYLIDLRLRALKLRPSSASSAFSLNAGDPRRRIPAKRTDCHRGMSVGIVSA